MRDYKYRQLEERLENEILHTHSVPGARIPTEHELCRRFNLSRNTVRQAVRRLVEKGFLTKVQGRGTFVSESMTEFFDKKRGSAGKRSIGVVMNKVNAYIFPSVLMGIADYLFQHDYHILIRMTHNRVLKEKEALEELVAAGLAGLIIEPTRSSLPQANEALYREIEKSIPCVLINSSLPGFSFPSVDTANAEGYELLVDHLADCGHRDIAALFKFDEQTGVKRYQGFVRAMLRRGLPVDERRIVWYGDEDFDAMFSEQNAPRVLKAIRDCSAVMCFNDEMAEKLVPFLDERGVSVPGDVSVVAFDDCWSTTAHKPVTTIRHPKEQLGRAAAKAALSLIDNPLAKASHIFPPLLVDHGSVLKLPNAVNAL